MMLQQIQPLAPLLRGLLLLVAIVAGVYDARYRRIPNWLTAAGVVAGFTAHGMLEGPSGLLTAVKGFALGFGIYLVLYLLRGMGAGDVKLMGALGSIAGPASWFALFLGASIFGAVVAVVMAMSKGRLGSTLMNVVRMVRELLFLRAPYVREPQIDVHHKDALRAPHGTIIAVAAILLMLWQKL